MQDNIQNRESLIEYIKTHFNKSEFDGNKIEVISDIEEEYHTINEHVAIRLFTSHSIIKLVGKDTLEFLHRISTNDVQKLEELKVKNTLFTNAKGRLIARTALLNCKDSYLLLGGKDTQSILERWISKYIITEEIELTDGRNEYLVVEILGPHADAYLTQICGKCVDDISEDQLMNFEMDELTARIYKHKQNNKYLRYYLIVKNENVEKTIEFLLEQNNLFDVKLIGEKAYNKYRVLNNWPGTPYEINNNFNPYEASLIHDVCFTKGCYIGQEVIARLDTYDKVQKDCAKLSLTKLLMKMNQ